MQPALFSTRFIKLSSIKCCKNSNIWVVLFCCKLILTMIPNCIYFRKPNKVLLLWHRSTQRLPDMAASTLLRLLKPCILSLCEHLGGITQIFPHRRHVGRVLMRHFSPVWISLLFQIVYMHKQLHNTPKKR